MFGDKSPLKIAEQTVNHKVNSKFLDQRLVLSKSASGDGSIPTSIECNDDIDEHQEQVIKIP